MANEIWHSYQDGSTLYALIWRQTDDKIYDAVAGSDTFDTYADADIGDYDVPLTAAGTTGDYYSVDFPAGISAGIYRVTVMLQAGASPHVDNDIPVAQGEIYWDGTAEVNIYTLSETDVAAIVAKLPTNYIMGSATQADQDTIIHGGTVPNNTSTADSIKLAATASGVNDIYNENIVVLISGTGSGQARLIADYVGGTTTAVVRNSWTITPDNTTVYRIYPFSGILLANTGICAGGSASSITLNASAPATADIYVGHTVYISGGTGEGQARLITAYSAGRVATVAPDWDVSPAASASVYIILPIGVGRVYETLEDIKGTGFVKDTDSLVDLAHTGADGDTLETLSDQIDTVDTVVDTVLVDTNELQTDLTNGGRLDLLIDAILEDTGTTLPAAITALNDITADDVHDEVIEGTVTFRQAMRLLLSVMTGKSSGGGTTTITFRDIADSKDRLSCTVDSSGNRTAVGTRDGT